MRELLILVFILVVLLTVVLSPFISIMAVNTLFNTGIPYNVSTWFASLWLTGCILRPMVSVKK